MPNPLVCPLVTDGEPCQSPIEIVDGLWICPKHGDVGMPKGYLPPEPMTAIDSDPATTPAFDELADDDDELDGCEVVANARPEELISDDEVDFYVLGGTKEKIEEYGRLFGSADA